MPHTDRSLSHVLHTKSSTLFVNESRRVRKLQDRVCAMNATSEERNELRCLAQLSLTVTLTRRRFDRLYASFRFLASVALSTSFVSRNLRQKTRIKASLEDLRRQCARRPVNEAIAACLESFIMFQQQQPPGRSPYYPGGGYQQTPSFAHPMQVQQPQAAPSQQGGNLPR